MASRNPKHHEEAHEGPAEIAFVGDLTDNESELWNELLDVPIGGECTLYFDSPGGSPYTAMSYVTLIKMRALNTTGIVAGECSSAALWPLAACVKRIVTPFSVLLFHPLRSQTEDHVGLAEATEWARHLTELETEMDQLLASLFGIPKEQLDAWMKPGRYVTGREFAKAGLAELVTFELDEAQRSNR